MIAGERCCRELGRPGAWRLCRARAVASAPRWIAGALMFVHYCKSHAKFLFVSR